MIVARSFFVDGQKSEEDRKKVQGFIRGNGAKTCYIHI
jgi:hypothetical protein